MVKPLFLCSTAVILFGCSPRAGLDSDPPVPTADALSSEKPADAAPDEFQVNFKTTKGEIVVAVHRDWAPNGVDRFYQLVKTGFFDGCRFFRVVPGFVVQFGITGDPMVQSQWRESPIADDPVVQSNKRGYLTFATAGPNTRTSQLFINLADNANLDGQGFSPFAEVTTGMDVVDSIYAGYGESPQQHMIQDQGNEYLTSEFPMLDYIETATIIEGG